MDNKLSYPATNGSQKKTTKVPVASVLTLGMEVLVEVIKMNIRLKTVLVGFEDRSFLLIKLSPLDLMGTFRSESIVSSPVVVKFQHRDIVYSFDTEIVNVVSRPSKLMFLDFPLGMEEYKVNPVERHECALPAMVMLANEIIDMTIIDINADGCLCVGAVPQARKDLLQKFLQINAIIELYAKFPEAKERLKMAGRIRNLGYDGDKLKLGINFENLSAESRGKIMELISKPGRPA